MGHWHISAMVRIQQDGWGEIGGGDVTPVMIQCSVGSFPQFQEQTCLHTIPIPQNTVRVADTHYQTGSRPVTPPPPPPLALEIRIRRRRCEWENDLAGRSQISLPVPRAQNFLRTRIMFTQTLLKVNSREKGKLSQQSYLRTPCSRRGYDVDMR